MTDEPTRTFKIADGDYDCRATDTNWRFGLLLDPESETVSFWQHYGNGTPERVYHRRARIVDLPHDAVGQHVLEIVKGDDFASLVTALFSAYGGTRWDGSNCVGTWKAGPNNQIDVLEDMIEGLFKDVARYWDAREWLGGGNWGEMEAQKIRDQISRGDTLESIAYSLVVDAWTNGAHIKHDDMRDEIERLLSEHPAECEADECAS